MRNIYASIDIGTYSCKFVVCEYFNNKIHVLASHSVNSKGIKKGLIVEPNLVVDTILEGMSEINSLLGIEIKKVLVNVPDYNAKFKTVTGITNVKENNVIQSDDISRVIKDSIYNKLDENYELVTMVPYKYIVDGGKEFSKPIGKNGQKLEIKGIMKSYII